MHAVGFRLIQCLLIYCTKIKEMEHKENIYTPSPVHSSSHQKLRMIQLEYLYMQEVMQVNIPHSRKKKRNKDQKNSFKTIQFFNSIQSYLQKSISEMAKVCTLAPSEGMKPQLLQLTALVKNLTTKVIIYSINFLEEYLFCIFSTHHKALL